MFTKKELFWILIASAIIAFAFSFFKDMEKFLNVSVFALYFLYALIILFASIIVKKLVAMYLQVKIEHKLAWWKRFFIYERSYFRKPIPIGILLPLSVTLISGGIMKVLTILQYDVSAKKSRITKKRSYPRFSELTEWDIGLIGIWGIGTVLFISLLSLIIGQTELAKMAALYSFWNMIPLFNLDGTKIFFGSRLAWIIEAILSVIFLLLIYLVP